MYPSAWVPTKAGETITGETHCFHDSVYKYTLRASYFCEIWALFVPWITYDHLHYSPYLVFWAPLGSLISAMCNRASCALVHEMPQSHCGNVLIIININNKNNINRSLLSQHMIGVLNVAGVHRPLYEAWWCDLFGGAPKAITIIRYLKLENN